MRTSKPEDVGLSSTRLARINELMQDYIDQNKLAGLITMVARQGKVAHFERFGLMDIEANKPMQFDTIFRLYSMTKPITSVAVLMLYEEGHFQLCDTVSKFIPEFKEGKVYVATTGADLALTDLERQITIRDLLTHTSGLDSGFGEDQPLETLYQEVEADSDRLDITLQERVHKLAKLPLLHQPGRAWRYGWSYDVLAYLVEVISDMSFDTFLQQRIIEPLGIQDMSFYVPEEKIERFSTLYGPAEDGGLEVIEGPASYENSRPQYPISGGTGLVSTAPDYVRFAQMLLNGGELDGTRLLSRKTVELMTMNQLHGELMPIAIDPDPDWVLHGYGYGLGVEVLMNVAQSGILGSEGSFGWGGYATTHFWVDPKEALIGLIMAQFAPVGYYPIHKQFKVLTYQAVFDTA
jgi:CubicO group peptidase (beta-lactamase class C family)